MSLINTAFYLVFTSKPAAFLFPLLPSYSSVWQGERRFDSKERRKKTTIMKQLLLSVLLFLSLWTSHFAANSQDLPCCLFATKYSASDLFHQPQIRQQFIQDVAAREVSFQNDTATYRKNVEGRYLTIVYNRDYSTLQELDIMLLLE